MFKQYLNIEILVQSTWGCTPTEDITHSSIILQGFPKPYFDLKKCGLDHFCLFPANPVDGKTKEVRQRMRNPVPLQLETNKGLTSDVGSVCDSHLRLTRNYYRLPRSLGSDIVCRGRDTQAGTVYWSLYFMSKAPTLSTGRMLFKMRESWLTIGIIRDIEYWVNEFWNGTKINGWGYVES